MPIYLIRHGQTVWNADERMQGQLDSPLTTLGINQAQNIGKFLKSQIKDVGSLRVISSPLGRALKTAGIICNELGIDSGTIIQDAILMEANHGIWSGLTKSNVKQKFPKEWSERKNNHWSYRFPEGESYADLSKRAAEWCKKASDFGGTTLAVTHEMMSRSIRGHYLGLDSEGTLQLSHSHSYIYALVKGKVEGHRLPK